MYDKKFIEHLNEVTEAERLLSPLPQTEIERRAKEFLELVKELSKYPSIREFLRNNDLSLDVGVGRGKMPLFLLLDAEKDGEEEIVVYFESKCTSFKIDDVDKLKKKIGILGSCNITNILASISEEMLVEMIKSVAQKNRQDWQFRRT